MRRLFLVRHGQTDANAEGRTIATSDPPLNAAGLAQAQRAARQLSTEPIDVVLTSPRLRCTTTAELILGQQPTVPALHADERLVELGMGAIEALSIAEIHDAGLDDVFARWRQGTPPSYPDGAETFDHAAGRALDLFHDLEALEVETALVVGHSHALRILIAVCVLGVDPAAHRRLFLDHATVTSIFWEGSSPRLERLNSVERL